MEHSVSAAYTTSPALLYPKTFFPKSRNCPQLFLNPHSSNRRCNRSPSLSVKASSTFKTHTLSSNWDVPTSNYAASAPTWMPRFEELDTTNMLLRQRIVFLGSQVDDMSADFIISQLLFLDAEDDKKDIKLFINSPGGSVTADRGKTCHHIPLPDPALQRDTLRMGIYDAIKLCKADVSTICVGLAASMGAFLLACGTKGKRFCMPNSKVMIHQPLGKAGGNATDMSIRIREMVYHKVKVNKILSKVSGTPYEKVEADTDRDYFMNAWEAKAYGLVDEVIDDGKPGLVAPLADSNPPPKTRVWDLWKVEGSRKALKNMPSEDKLLQNGHIGGQEGEDEPKQEEPASA